MWLASLLFALWFLKRNIKYSSPFVVSLVFAYMLNPIVDLFSKLEIRGGNPLVLILYLLQVSTLVLFFVLPVALAHWRSTGTLSKDRE